MEGHTSFVAIVAEEFGFLAERGFHSVVEDEARVRFDRADGLFVSVFFDQYDRYVGFRIGLASQPRNALTDAELVKLSGAAPDRSALPFVEQADQLLGAVARAANDLRMHGDRPLSGDEGVYEEAMELRRAHTDQYIRRDEGSRG